MDIGKLTRKELIELNHRIVARLEHLDELEVQAKRQEFILGSLKRSLSMIKALFSYVLSLSSIRSQYQCQQQMVSVGTFQQNEYYRWQMPNKRLKRDCQRVAFPVPMSRGGFGCCG